MSPTTRLLILMVFFVTVPSISSAQEIIAETKDDFFAPVLESADIHDVPAGIGPGHPLYLFDSLGERAQLAFTFNKQKRTERALNIAEEKLAELDVLKAQVEFDGDSEDVVSDETLTRAYERYEHRMQEVDSSLARVKATEELPALIERVVQKQAEHKAAFSEHAAVMPEDVRIHIEARVQHMEQRQQEMIERIENPVAKARVLENITKHQELYAERRQLWLDTQTEARRAAEEARALQETSPEQVEEVQARIEERFRDLEQRREAQFEQMRQEREVEKRTRQVEAEQEQEKLEAAGFESREEAIEAYEALDETGREKMRTFFGVEEEDADRVLNEIRDLRSEHGEAWKARLEERNRMDEERIRREMEKAFERDAQEFDEERALEREDFKRLRGEFESGARDRMPEGFEAPPSFDERSFDAREGIPVDRRPIRPPQSVPLDADTFQVTPEPGFIPYDDERKRGEPPYEWNDVERIYRDAPELPEGSVLAPPPPESAFPLPSDGSFIPPAFEEQHETGEVREEWRPEFGEPPTTVPTEPAFEFQPRDVFAPSPETFTTPDAPANEAPTDVVSSVVQTLKYWFQVPQVGVHITDSR